MSAKKEPTRVIRVPVALLSDIQKLITDHKVRIGDIPKDKGAVAKDASVTKKINTV